MAMDSERLEDHFKIVEGRGNAGPLLATIAAEVTFYFPTTESTIAALPAIYERIVDAMGPRATFILIGMDTARPRKFRPADRGVVSNWAKSASRFKQYGLSIRSGATAATEGPWSLELSVEPLRSREQEKRVEARQQSSQSTASQRELSYLYFTMPLSLLTPDSAPFRHLTFEVAAMLPFRSGHAGLGLAYDDADPKYDRDQQLAAWNKRYQGLDVGSPDCSAEFAANHIRGVSWLTMLDNELLAKVGGRQAIEALGPDIAVHSLRHGVMIQAGEAPRLGDVNELEDMTPYVKVNRLLKPIRAEDMYPPTGMEIEDARAWLARFDER